MIDIINPTINELTSNEVNNIVALINKVYLITESEFWPQNGDYARTTNQEIKKCIEKGELLIAKKNNIIVGAVHVYSIDNNIGGFGMLVSDPNYRRLKIGSTLVQKVEEWCKLKNHNLIQLELLRPDNFIHPDKEFLEDWYKRIGYKLITKTAYKTLYPEQAHLLKTPCTFYIYTKNI